MLKQDAVLTHIFILLSDCLPILRYSSGKSGSRTADLVDEYDSKASDNEDSGPTHSAHPSDKGEPRGWYRRTLDGRVPPSPTIIMDSTAGV